MFICKHCKKEFEGLSPSQKANHSRWCTENPKRSLYGKDVSHLNTESAKQKRNESIKKAHAAGKYINSYKKSLETKRKNGTLCHTEESKQKIREAALRSNHRRLVRSVREYIKKDGTVVLLDSSWEEALARRLDNNNISWIRPEVPISYTTKDGINHNYFPDFYLPDYNLFLDPKNPAAYAAQKVKLEIITKMMDNLIIITSIDECLSFEL